MKKLLYAFALSLMAGSTQAAPGDTTWVQAHNDMQLDHYGAFDVPVTFPDGSLTYRKIIMTVTLGKYQCPGNPQYCGDWDYTVSNFLMTPGGDTLELGRLITPYANATAARTPWTWRQRYEFDVTDFYTVMKDAAHIRLFYSGYSWGFTGDIKFAFIEGTPPRNVLGIDRLWNGSFTYGNPANPISNYMTTKTKTVPANTQSTEMRFTVTGHGADNSYCSEFCSKYYEVSVNNTVISKTDIWRDDCGKNHIYPQSGTWLYDRGNWCPGDLIHPNIHTLTGATAGNTYTVDLDFEPYTGSISNGGSWGSYIVQTAVWYYGGFNHTNDASLEDIIAPSDHEVHFRENPRNGNPLIKVKNTGSNAITSLKIEYGVNGKSMKQYSWSGNIASLQEQVIELPVLADLQSAVGQGKFTAKLVETNGQADQDNTNNALTTGFNAAPQWPEKFIVIFKTNNVTENTWKIFDADNKMVAEREGFDPGYTYNDTLNLKPGMYRFEMTDFSCDGLRFWANSSAGNGNIQVKAADNFKFYSLDGAFNGDFGCGFKQYFNIGWPTSVKDVESNVPAITAYPNPAQDVVQIALTGLNDAKGEIYIADAAGRVVVRQPYDAGSPAIHIGHLSNGLYTIVYTGADHTSCKTRIVVAK